MLRISFFLPKPLSQDECKLLAQYPAGTRFEECNLGSLEDAAPVLRAINEVAAEHGLDVIQERPTH
jgi:hypothetical protein